MKFSPFIGLAGVGLMLAGGIALAQPDGDTAAPDESGEHPAVLRIEVIVFRHADGRSDRTRAADAVDYTDHLDPLLVATANELAEQRLAELTRVGPPVAISSRIDETTPFLQTEDETIRPIPPAYAALGKLSDPVQRVMTRLIDAPDYEPVIARAWMQPAPPGQRTATVRVHDQTVVDVIVPPETAISPVLAEALPFPPLNKDPARPLEIYRLDGTVRLRRRQFLHLDLDLVWQTPAGALAGSVEQPITIGDGDWRLHRLQQSRIVEPGRLEYFDSSLFGVLVRIERFEQVVPEIELPESEPEAPTPEPGESAAPVTDSGG